MGLSGFVGGAALDELERMVAQQEIERRMKMNEEGQAFDRQLRQMQFEAQQQERSEAAGHRQRQEARQVTADQKVADQTAHESTARSNMSELLNDPTQLAAFSTASGVDVSPAVRDLIKPPPPEELTPVDTVGPGGRRIRRGVTREELERGVPVYQEPKEAPKPEKPTYIQVVGPDGTMQVLTPEEIRARGGVATAKGGNQPDPSKAQDVLRKIVEEGGKLKGAPGLGSLTGARLGNPSYRFGLSDQPEAGTDAATAQAYYDTLKSVMTLENLGLLTGAMSDKDIQFLQSAGSSLNTRMDDTAFVAELDRIIGKAQAALTPGVSHDPPAPGNGGGPAVGTEGVVNGVPAIWDGKGWLPKGQ